MEIHWQELDLKNPPEISGVYGVKDDVTGEWFYIGKSKNIAKRFKWAYHPVWIAASLDRRMSFWCMPLAENQLNSVERFLLRECHPIGNGGTSFEPRLYSTEGRVWPQGLTCSNTILADREAAAKGQQRVLDLLFPVD